MFRFTKLAMTVIMVVAASIAFSQSQLLKPAEALEMLSQDDVSVIDIRKAEEFTKGHLPNAINIWRDDIENKSLPYKGIKAEKGQIETLFSQLGIKSDDKLLLYDNRGLCEAARLWWVLYTYGKTNDIYFLDGGITTWNNAGYELSTEITIKEPSEFKLNDSNNSLTASLKDIKQAIDNQNVQILDTRSDSEYKGEYIKDNAFKAGHIPTSLFMDWANLIDYEGDHSIRSKDEITERLGWKGIDPEKPVIVYCHSGVRSAHTTFVLSQIYGMKNVRNYDGSWIEYSYHDLPVAIGEYGDEKLITGEEATQPIKPSIWSKITESYKGFSNYTWNEITFRVTPWYVNYFWMLIILSLAVWLLEIIFPWRKNQPIFRKDFWLDAFYMFFNFYIFKIVIFAAFSAATEEFFLNTTGLTFQSLALIDISTMPQWLQLLIFFIATDFIQWFTHVILHRFDIFWRFHKVHHSVEEMGFAAHLRYHWMENVFYTPMKYIAVMLIGGFTPDQAFIVFYLAISIGHLNHANLHWTYGPLKYIFNNPVMHLWHHVYALPEGREHGINFGISLSLWDYIFRTASIPKDDAHIKLGFPKMESFPKTFFGQLFSGFKRNI